MCWALIEGLAGVVDRGRGLDVVGISPRWLAAGVDSAEVEVGYACSGCGIAYRFDRHPDRIVLEVDAAHAGIGFHVLLPEGVAIRGVRRGGCDLAFRSVMVEQSRYADFEDVIDGGARYEIGLD